MTSVRDIIIVAVILFAVGIAVTFAVMISHKVNTNLQGIGSINSSSQAVTVIQKADTAINMSDYLYLALFLGFFLSIPIFAWFIEGDSIMAPIYFILVTLFTLVAIVLQLVWADLVTQSDVLVTIVNLPLTNFIIGHLGYFTCLMGLVGIAVMYAKPASNGGNTF